MSKKRISAITSLLLLCSMIGGVAAGGEWRIDLQGDENHGGVYSQTDPVDMTEEGVVWNIFEVPALDAASPGPASFAEGPTSLELLNVDGKAEGVVFTDLSDAWGWAGSAGQESQPMAGDYLIMLNSFGVECDPTSWEITGLAPGSECTLTFENAANDNAGRGCNFVANGVTAQVTGAAGATAATITVTADETGTISGTVDSDGFGEGNWAGLVIVGTAAPVDKASGPSPEMEQTEVLFDADLEWAPGIYANTHDVYLGLSLADVSNADRSNPLGVLIGEGQATTTIDPGHLDFGQTYYWRVDEVNGAPDYSIIKGDIWSFTVEPLARPVESVVATSNGSSDPGNGPENTVNGSGLNASNEHSTVTGDMWAATPGDNPPWIQFELDRAYKLHEILIWNYNVEFEILLGFGIKDVTVEYSIDGADWTVLGDVQLAQGTTQEDYVANSAIDMGGVIARYVRLNINSAFGTTGKFGLSEVRFMYIPTFAREPEPADSTTTEDADVVLTWRAGREAATHEVYLGTSVGETTQWKIDFQGDANHGNVYNQTDPVDMVEDGATWNIFEVPALDAAYPGPASFVEGPISLELLDTEGNAAGLVFTDLSDAWGWSGGLDQQSQPMAGDYLLIMSSFGVDCNPSSWELTGLTPRSDYELTFHHAANGAAGRGCNFTANGVAAQVTGVDDTTTITVRTDEVGAISGTVNSDEFGEGNWAGLVISGAPLVDLVLAGTIEENTFSANGLIYDQTYYWQIIEVNELEAPSAHAGPIWRFTTPAYTVIEDFESYTDDEGSRIYETWVDGYEITANGSMVGHLDAPFAERDIVNNGSQSMPLFYDNTGTTISEAEYTFPAQDWSAGGIESLSLHFFGAGGNDGQLYVKINNTKILYDGGADDIARTLWQPWNIDLSTVGGNLSSVTTLVIGIEGAGARGVVYVDDIRLYPRTPEFITPIEPDTANLVAHYTFEGNAADSSGNGVNGVEEGDPLYGDGQSGQAVYLDGIGDFIDFGAPSVWPSGAAPRSMCGWGMTSSVDAGFRWIIAYGSPSAGQAMFLGLSGVDLYGGAYTDDLMISDFWMVDEWLHVGLTYDGVTARLYAGGIEVASEPKTWDLVPSRAYVGQQVNEAEFWDGAVDEVRLYDRALTAEELAWLAGRRMPIHAPF